MCAHSQPHQHVTFGRTHAFYGDSIRACAKACLTVGREHIIAVTSIPAGALLACALLVLLSACGRQPSPDALNQIQSRLEQLERRIEQCEAKNAELTEWVNEGKAGAIKLEETLAALTQQVEKTASRPSTPSLGPSSQPSVTPAAAKKYHTVARGETLYSIAKRYGLSVDELRRINRLTPDQTIQAGQSLAVSRDTK